MYRRLRIALFLALIVGTPAVWAGGALPDGFMWGTVVSAHAVEGSHANDWTLWEETPGHAPPGGPSGQACNHWELYAEDHVWMQKLGQNSVILSLEWSRLEPNPGSLDPQAVEHYRQVLGSLRSHNIEPIVVLWDRTLPQWVAAYGGLEAPGIILNFSDFAGRSARAFGDLVDYWIPLRDPVGYAKKAFKDGACPPGKSDVVSYGKAIICMMGMHRGAWQSIKEGDTVAASGKVPSQIGLLVGMNWVRPHRQGNSMDITAARSADILSCWSFIDGIMKGDLISGGPVQNGPKGKGMPPETQTPPNYDSRKADFIVAAYGGLEEIKFNILQALGVQKIVPPGMSVDESGQVVFPDGLTSVLLSLKKYPVPLFAMIGMSDSGGALRAQFILDHVRQLKAAVVQGCDIRGLFYDSFLSGFEYEKGYSLKRGLINVQFSCQERKAAGGAHQFAALAKSNGENETPPKQLRRPKTPAPNPPTSRAVEP